MKIGELAKSTGTQIETIRYYERVGLLPAPARTEGNYRFYDATHVERLSFIRHCRSLDMTLEEIRVLLRFKHAPAEHCAEVNALLDEHIGHVAERVRELRALEAQLRALRARCRESRKAEHCGILNELCETARQGHNPAGRAHTHVAGVHHMPQRCESLR
ncbi:MAG: Cd(II)/Pb(II)-responsive transcriptional regulator [Burkholderiaceae bacterium]|nr:Cd(II)/Pb(II)-responsive transcriptional regulator [Burkholderiaceae bacterium]